MLTRRQKRTLDSLSDLTILALPDVPLLLVLSHLSVKDLWAAGLAHPRLGALTRGHTSLWRGKEEGDRYRFQTGVAELLGVVCVMPPVCTLKCKVKHNTWMYASFSVGTDQVTAGTTLSVNVSRMGDCVSILQKVKPKQAHLVLPELQSGLGRLGQSVVAARYVASLDLDKCKLDAVRDLSKVLLPNLRHLAIQFAFGHVPQSHELLGPLEQALQGFPILHSLYLLQRAEYGLYGSPPMSPSEVLSSLPVGAIPNLSLILYTQYIGSIFDPDFDPLSGYKGFQRCRDLVRRSPVSLHVASMIYMAHNLWQTSKSRCVLFFRHSTAEPSVALCPLCAEAQAAVTLHCHVTHIDRVQVQS